MTFTIHIAPWVWHFAAGMVCGGLLVGFGFVYALSTAWAPHNI